MSEPKPPALPMVLGTGWLADAVRAQIAADPDAYRPTTWSTRPVGKCTCCGELVFRATTRHTGWRPGFSTHDNVVHPSFKRIIGRFNVPVVIPDPDGPIAGCCCKPGAWGPKRAEGGGG